MSIATAIDWNAFLLYGIPAWIAAAGGAIAAILSSRNHRSLQMSNGKTIAQAVESTHDAVAAGVVTMNKISDTQDQGTNGGTNV